MKVSGSWVIGGRRVNRIGLGAMRLTGSEAFTSLPTRIVDEALAVLRRAVEIGVNHIDTAAFYFSSGMSANTLIREALSPYPEDLLLATKVGPSRSSDGEWLPRSTPQELRAQVEDNLLQLGCDRLGLVYFRRQGEETIDDHVEVLFEMHREGLIGGVGLSGVTPEQLNRAHAIAPISAVQNRFGLEYREPETMRLIEACGERDIAFVPYFAVAGPGRHQGPQGPTPENLLAVATRHNLSPAQVRIAWTLGLAPHILAIPGTGNLKHLEENVAAGGAALRDEDVQLLNR